jgi:hypothetical protein
MVICAYFCYKREKLFREVFPKMTVSNTQEPTTVEKMRGLPWGIAADITNTIFVQFTFFGSVFILFLSELGLSKTQMGFLLSFMYTYPQKLDHVLSDIYTGK